MRRSAEQTEISSGSEHLPHPEFIIKVTAKVSVINLDDHIPFWPRISSCLCWRAGNPCLKMARRLMWSRSLPDWLLQAQPIRGTWNSRSGRFSSSHAWTFESLWFCSVDMLPQSYCVSPSFALTTSGTTISAFSHLLAALRPTLFVTPSWHVTWSWCEKSGLSYHWIRREEQKMKWHDRRVERQCDDMFQLFFDVSSRNSQCTTFCWRIWLAGCPL